MTWLIVVLAVVVVLVLAAVAAMQIRSRSLRQRFGPEYERLIDEKGDRRRAEAELRQREMRRSKLEILELEPGTRQAYAVQWRDVQKRFVDEPEACVTEAHVLVQTVMQQRGYPVDDFEERIKMVSVDHPELAENYRVAHAIQVQSEQDAASIDDLREAFQRYRSLFAELLADGHQDLDKDMTDDLRKGAR